MNNTEYICDFTGEYDFLSNSYESEIYFDNIKWKTVDQACLASICRYKWDREAIRNAASLDEAWAMTKKFEKNDESKEPLYRYAVMKDCLLRKFLCIDELTDKLLKTGDKKIFDGSPDNIIGSIIMEIRKNIRANNYIWGAKYYSTVDGKEDWAMAGYYRRRIDAELVLKSHKDWFSQSPCPLDNDHLFIIEIK